MRENLQESEEETVSYDAKETSRKVVDAKRCFKVGDSALEAQESSN